jgi:beta-N-acetylhexosaminidase
LELLAERDLVPYRQLVGTGPGVMLGHLTVPGLTDGMPASTSAAAVSYLRNELGYADALVMTDALDMEAAGGSVPDTAVAAIVAGADVVLFTSTGQTGAVIDAIVAAMESSRLSAERLNDAAGRVLALLAERGHGCAN